METREKLKIILSEWTEFQLPELFLRDFDPRLLEGREILSIIGARRSGKTYLCYQLIKKLKNTLPRDNIIYINLEDERLYPFKGDELSLLWDLVLEVFSPDTTKKIYLFVDEIQNIPGWSKWARRITEQNRNLKLIITGSSSRFLSREIASELRGRTLTFTVFPLSFREYLRARGLTEVNEKNILYSKKRILVKKYFNDYFKNGGFPAVLESTRPEELLKEYFSVMFYRDLVERFKIKNVKLLSDYLTLLFDQTACDFSISSTAKKLSEFGYSFSKNTLSNFSRYAEDAFLVFGVKKFSYKIKEQLRAVQKIYAIDHGLVQAVRFAFSGNYGRMMENIVYLELKRSGKDIYYFKNNRECDFILVEKNKVRGAIQVCQSLSEPRTKKREIDGLAASLEHFELKEGLILTAEDHNALMLKGKTIHILPLWYWLVKTRKKIWL